MRQRVEVLHCDKCGNEVENIKSFGIDLERYCDASGNTSTRSLEFELCTNCIGSLLNRLYFQPLSRQDNLKSTLERLGIKARVVD